MKLAAGVAWVVSDDVVYVARLPSGPILVLAGTAALIWTELIDPSAQGHLVERVRRRVSGSSRGLASDVRAFVARLESEGWVVDDPSARPVGPTSP